MQDQAPKGVFQIHHRDSYKHAEKLPQYLRDKLYRYVPFEFLAQYNATQRKVLIACNNYLIGHKVIGLTGRVFTHTRPQPKRPEQYFV